MHTLAYSTGKYMPFKDLVCLKVVDQMKRSEIYVATFALTFNCRINPPNGGLINIIVLSVPEYS
jgi:hypothetical protein